MCAGVWGSVWGSVRVPATTEGRMCQGECTCASRETPPRKDATYQRILSVREAAVGGGVSPGIRSLGVDEFSLHGGGSLGAAR